MCNSTILVLAPLNPIPTEETFRIRESPIMSAPDKAYEWENNPNIIPHSDWLKFNFYSYLFKLFNRLFFSNSFNCFHELEFRQKDIYLMN